MHLYQCNPTREDVYVSAAINFRSKRTHLAYRERHRAAQEVSEEEQAGTSVRRGRAAPRKSILRLYTDTRRDGEDGESAETVSTWGGWTISV